MYTRIREQFTPAALILSLVAIVLALGGAAIAASGGLSGKQKKEVSKIAKKEAQKYANSNPGAPGTNGTNGKDGAPGAPGKDGTNGTNGTNAEGTSFSGEKTVGSVTCKEGGVEVKSAKPATAVCNGKEGSPWTAGGTLPSGQTETGAWSFSSYELTAGKELYSPISFPIQLAAPSGEGKAFVLTKEEIDNEEGPGFDAGCTGTAVEPTALPGTICAYTGLEELSNAVIFFGTFLDEEFGTYQPTGTVLHALTTGEPAEVKAYGTWAVTAP